MLKSTIINQKKIFFFEKRFFELKGTHFEITGSHITGPGAYDVLHTIRNTATGESKDLMMNKLVHILNPGS